MKVLSAAFAVCWILWPPGQLLAGGSGVAARLGNPGMAGEKKSLVQRSWRSGPFIGPVYPYPYLYYGYPPAVIVLPSYPTYYVPGAIAVSAPFFCLAHHVGFVSRVGMLDHLSAIHKLPLETAVYLCPEGDPGCIVDGY